MARPAPDRPLWPQTLTPNGVSSMSLRRLFLALAGTALVAGLAVAAFFTRDLWRPWLTSLLPQAESRAPGGPGGLPGKLELTQVKISPQARQNLGLVTKPVQVQTYRRTIQVPGMVVDRPGQSDRGVTAPAVSVVTKVHAYPGDTVRPGERLFTLRLISEYLQNSQAELFKTTRDIQRVTEQRELLQTAARRGAVAEATIIDLDNQLKKLNAAIQSHRQDLLTRGLTPSQIDGVAEGTFVAEVEVVAPRPQADDRLLVTAGAPAPAGEGPTLAYEVQELKAELGQQVQAGQTLCLLANHQSLYIEGRGFKREAALLEQAAQKGWQVEVEFAEDGGQETWPALEQTFAIRHLANTVDPASRTFAFYIPLTNQSRAYEKDGKTFLIWRFRPGQRVRLHVPVEEFKGDPVEGSPGEFTGVIVLPAEAVVREGPEAYAFRENGDFFDKKPVTVLYEDRRHVVLKADGSLAPGVAVAQNGAAALLRVLKAQSAALSGGLPPGFHVHPDGTVHGAH